MRWEYLAVPPGRAPGGEICMYYKYLQYLTKLRRLRETV